MRRARGLPSRGLTTVPPLLGSRMTASTSPRRRTSRRSARSAPCCRSCVPATGSWARNSVPPGSPPGAGWWTPSAARSISRRASRCSPSTSRSRSMASRGRPRLPTRSPGTCSGPTARPRGSGSSPMSTMRVSTGRSHRPRHRASSASISRALPERPRRPAAVGRRLSRAVQSTLPLDHVGARLGRRRAAGRLHHRRRSSRKRALGRRDRPVPRRGRRGHQPRGRHAAHRRPRDAGRGRCGDSCVRARGIEFVAIDIRARHRSPVLHLEPRKGSLGGRRPALLRWRSDVPVSCGRISTSSTSRSAPHPDEVD